VAPPAVCELDGDIESEIVSATAGYIHAVNHDGTSRPAGRWTSARSGGRQHRRGRHHGNGDNEVVAGNDAGYIHALDAHGVALAGWPRYIGVKRRSTWLPPYHPRAAGVACGIRRCCSTRQRQLGIELAMPTAGNVNAAPAIGDVDSDGDREIVILQNQFMNAPRRRHRRPTAISPPTANSRTPPRWPTDLDGDLEIMAPSDQAACTC
jgi:hypothetical protein